MLYFTLNNGETAGWHVGQKVPDILDQDRWEQDEEPGRPTPWRDKLYVAEVFADSDELTHVLAQFDNIPKLHETTEDNATTNLIVRNMRGTRWFGHTAQFIHANMR